MPMTERRIEQLPVPDGGELWLTVAEPESVIRGGIVVFHEAGARTDAVGQMADELADELAGEGWLALVPELTEPLSVDSILLDVDAAVRRLTERGVGADRIGVVGYGWGGTVALLVATQRDFGAAVTIDGLGVVAPVTPALPAMVQAASELRCPWLGIYRGGGPVPEDEVRKLQAAVHSARVATHLVWLGAGEQRPGTRHGGATEAWTRTLNWFDSHLR